MTSSAAGGTNTPKDAAASVAPGATTKKTAGGHKPFARKPAGKSAKVANKPVSEVNAEVAAAEAAAQAKTADKQTVAAEPAVAQGKTAEKVTVEAVPAPSETPVAPAAAAAPVTAKTAERTVVQEAPAPAAAESVAAPAAPAPEATKQNAKKPSVKTTKTEDRATPTGRRVRLMVSRIDPWSALKLSFLLSVAVGIMMVVVVGVLWTVLNAMGVFRDVNALLEQLAPAGQTVNVNNAAGFGRVLSSTTVVAITNVIFTTLLATISAVIYNIAAQLVGGLRVTLSDE